MIKKIIAMCLCCISIAGCSAMPMSRDAYALRIETYLEDKYNEDFVVSKVQRRTDGSVHAIAYPADDSNAVFDAVIPDVNKPDVSDEYIKTMMGHRYADAFSEIMYKYGYDSKFGTLIWADSVMPDADRTTDLQEYADNSENAKLNTSGIVNGHIDADTLQNATKDFYNKYHMGVSLFVYVITDSGDYHSAERLLSSYGRLTMAEAATYNPDDTFIVNCDSDRCQVRKGDNYGNTD